MKKILIGAAAIATLYAIIQYFNLAGYMTFGIGMAVGLLANSTNATPVWSVFFGYILQLIQLIAPALIIGFALALFKQQKPFRTAFLSAMIAYILSAILAAFFVVGWTGQIFIPLILMFVSYIITVILLARINRPILTWVIVIVLLLISLLAVPAIVSGIGRPIAESRRANELTSATTDMKFTAYYPVYIPEGLVATDAKLEGYHDTTYQHKRVSYEVGKLEVMISEKLKNQDLVFNKQDNCDISTIWFEMRTKDVISEARVDRSLDNLAICRILGKTDDGHEVYIEANKSQFEFYYMEIDSTIIVMQHDKLPKPRYVGDFEREVLKIYNTMEKVRSADLKPGY